MFHLHHTPNRMSNTMHNTYAPSTLYLSNVSDQRRLRRRLEYLYLWEAQQAVEHRGQCFPGNTHCSRPRAAQVGHLTPGIFQQRGISRAKATTKSKAGERALISHTVNSTHRERLRRMEAIPKYKDRSFGATGKQGERCNILGVIDIGRERHDESLAERIYWCCLGAC